MKPNITLKIALCFFIFIIAWAKFSFENNYTYIFDYLSRIIILIIIFSYIKKEFKFDFFKFKKDFFYCFIVIFLFIFFSDFFRYSVYVTWIDDYFFEDVGFPKIENSFLLFFDLTVGLILVSLTEESVFRALFVRLAHVNKWNCLKLYFWSSFWFAFIHLPQGLVDTFIAFLFGIIFMYFFRKTGSLMFVIIAHTLVNMWYFNAYDFFLSLFVV